jgi:hypothetical protein
VHVRSHARCVTRGIGSARGICFASLVGGEAYNGLVKFVGRAMEGILIPSCHHRRQNQETRLQDTAL